MGSGLRVGVLGVIVVVCGSVGIPVAALSGVAGADQWLGGEPASGTRLGLGGAAPASGGFATSAIDGADIPPAALDAYRAATTSCPGLGWEVLAGIGKVETDHGRSLLPGVRSGTNPAGAAGPMQFLLPTFEEYGADAGDGDPPSPYDLGDAAGAAARMLCANGAPSDLRRAVWAYNHSDDYVSSVLGWSVTYASIARTAESGATRARVALRWALAQRGRPYAWGAAGPDAYDCSGLVLRAWQAAGVGLARVAADQYREGRHVPLAAARPGDLVFFGTDPGDPTSVDHVGLVAGPGVMVDAPHTGAVVRLTAFYDGVMPLVVRPA
ncbi:MAG: NlpC/P60 family protein [Acidimicrobiales bacterium]